MPLLGAHMSIAGHPHEALLRGNKVGCQIIQIFTRNRITWSSRPLTREEIDAFHKVRIDTFITPVAIHCSYLINLASPLRDTRKESIALLLDEMEWARLLGIPYLVLHPGSHMGAGEKKGLLRVAEAINKIYDRPFNNKVKILLETTAGQGTVLGYSFEHLAEILERTAFPERLGVCFDTCHVFAAGYDFRTKKSYRQIFEKFNRIIGLNKLNLFHVNDSKNGPGSRRDRHDHLGKGHIGLRPFSFLLNDLTFDELPFLLETPKGLDKNGMDLDVLNLKILKRISNYREKR